MAYYLLFTYDPPPAEPDGLPRNLMAYYLLFTDDPNPWKLMAYYLLFTYDPLPVVPDGLLSIIHL